MTTFYLGIFAASVALSFLFTRYVRHFAVVRGLVSTPAQDRHLHVRPLPRLGGVAIVLAFLLTGGVGLLIGGWRHKLSVDLDFRTLAGLLLPGLLIFALGVYDDLHPVRPYVKFAVQTVAGCILFALGFRILDLPVLVGHHSSFSWFISLPLTILWVLAITNAFNLIDGLDGLAAGSALFSTMVVFVVALLDKSSFVALMSLALAGAILGFLRFNFNPATIFLGDCGSLFIGFMLSALALRGAQKAPTIIAVAIPVVSFGLPILETALSILRRFIGGRPVFTADREHIHHKLLQRGLSHRQVVIVLYAVSALFALLSLFLLWPTGSTLGLVLVVLGTGIWLGVQHLGYLEFGELRRVAQRTMEQRQIFINNLSIRRAAEELKVVQGYEQLCRVLVAAFAGNDFDAFELRCRSLPKDPPPIHGLTMRASSADEPCLSWDKPSSYFKQNGTAWSVTLDLVSGGNRWRGSFTLYRLYTSRDLQLDINLLTSSFPGALAEALDIVFGRSLETLRVGTRPEDQDMMAAQAG